jgi:hypothetical protein
MVVFVLVREDQNEHGYIDTSIIGTFRDEVSWRIEEHGRRFGPRRWHNRVPLVGTCVAATDGPRGQRFRGVPSGERVCTANRSTSSRSPLAISCRSESSPARASISSAAFSSTLRADW